MTVAISLMLASSDADFLAAFRLNYSIFVEELQLHRPNEEKQLIDRFHHRNTYLLAYQGAEAVGMICVTHPARNEKRSIDEKLTLRSEVPPEAKFAAELRLFAVLKEHRNTRVAFALFSFVARYLQANKYESVLASAVLPNDILYEKVGFEAFDSHKVIGRHTFVPMICKVATLQEKLLKQEILSRESFIADLEPNPERHWLVPCVVPHGAFHLFPRHSEFRHLFGTLRTAFEECFALPQRCRFAFFSGGGTLACESMIQSLRIRGLTNFAVVVNGHFGERLAQLLRRQNFNPICIEMQKAQFDVSQVTRCVESNPGLQALFMCHLETSFGQLNPVLAVSEVLSGTDILLAVDAISSLGGDLSSLAQLGQVDLLAFVAGKFIGAPPGISGIVASQRLVNLPIDETQIRCRSIDFDEQEQIQRERSEFLTTPATILLPYFLQALHLRKLIDFRLQAERRSSLFRYIADCLAPFAKMIETSHQSAFVSTFQISFPQKNALHCSWRFKSTSEIFDWIEIFLRESKIEIYQNQTYHRFAGLFQIALVGHLTFEIESKIYEAFSELKKEILRDNDAHILSLH